MTGFDVLAAIERAENHCVGQAWDLGLDLREARARVEALISATAEMNRLAKGPTGGVSATEKRSIIDRVDSALAAMSPPA